MMPNQQPTKEQKQWVWEQCGLERPHKSCQEPNHMVIRKGGYPFCQEVPIDLNNLFKYAVPILEQYTKAKVLSEWTTVISNSDTDPALALFWAIYKSLGGKE